MRGFFMAMDGRYAGNAGAISGMAMDGRYAGNAGAISGMAMDGRYAGNAGAISSEALGLLPGVCRKCRSNFQMMRKARDKGS